MIKTIKHFANITSTANGGIYLPDVVMGPEEISGFSHCDVLCVIGTMSGVTNTAGMSFYFQELFGDDYITTAQIQGVTGTTIGSAFASGAYIATYDVANSAGTYAPPSTNSNALLGKGTLKRIVATATAAMTAVNAEFYVVFFQA